MSMGEDSDGSDILITNFVCTNFFFRSILYIFDRCIYFWLNYTTVPVIFARDKYVPLSIKNRPW